MQLLQLQAPSPNFFQRWSDFVRYDSVLVLHDLLFFDVLAYSELSFLAYRVPHLLRKFMRLFSSIDQIKSATVVCRALSARFPARVHLSVTISRK